MALKHLFLSGWPNPVAADLTTITAGAEGATMKAANLKDGEPTNPARLTSIFPHQSYWEVNFKVATQVRALALVEHSLIPGDQVRVVGMTSGALPAVRSQTLPPTAIEASVNMQATSVLVLDEHPSTTDNSLALPTVETDPWSIRLSFGTPSSTPAVGGDYQCFLARVRQVNTSQSAADFPTVKASLYESGVLRKVLGTKAFTLTDPGTTGRFVIFPWNASDLQTADGSAVELLLEFEPGSGLAYGGLDSASLEVLSATDKAAADFDTGWETIVGAEPDPEWGNTALDRVDLPPALWHRFIDPAITLERLRVELRGDGMGFFDDFQATPPRTPNGYIDAGCLLGAPAFHAGYRFAPGGVLTIERENVGGGDSLTGVNRTVTQWKRRRAEVELPLLSETQAGSLLERLGWAAGEEQPGLVALEPGSSSRIGRLGVFWTIIAEVHPLSYVEGGQVDGERARGIGFTFRERR